MSMLAWIIIGVIAGLIASKLATALNEMPLLNIIIGIIGAVVSGYLFTAIEGTGVMGFNLYSMLVAVIGAALLLWLCQAIFGIIGMILLFIGRDPS
jgi:uncharacterized membrane protein YeaQ/YmgE (transglycosylase-associated protein family)